MFSQLRENKLPDETKRVPITAGSDSMTNWKVANLLYPLGKTEIGSKIYIFKNGLRIIIGVEPERPRFIDFECTHEEFLARIIDEVKNKSKIFSKK